MLIQKNLGLNLICQLVKRYLLVKLLLQQWDYLQRKHLIK